ncbi:hypothetical protein AYJ57_25325 (plasmid) [Salipiger sp. CCB-MM3]|nr:hypothetical protein AYJ57_25325 [Salipiger sp. CCB-MM3]
MRNVWIALPAVDVAVDLKFGAYGCAIQIIALSVNTIVAAVLILRLPDDNEATIAKGSYAGDILRAVGIRIDLKL